MGPARQGARLLRGGQTGEAGSGVAKAGSGPVRQGRSSSVAGGPVRPDPANGGHGKRRMVVGRAGCSGRRRCWIRGQAWEWARDGLSGLVMGLAGFSFFNFFI